MRRRGDTHVRARRFQQHRTRARRAYLHAFIFPPPVSIRGGPRSAPHLHPTSAENSLRCASAREGAMSMCYSATSFGLRARGVNRLNCPAGDVAALHMEDAAGRGRHRRRGLLLGSE
jgi:hypothetical protein